MPAPYLIRGEGYLRKPVISNLEVAISRILALDVGDARIGVAVSDPLNIIATPLTIINRRNLDDDIKTINDIVAKYDAGRIIVGLPFSMDGTLGYQADKVRDFVDALTPHSSVPIEYRDERLSTVSAKHALQETRKIDRTTRFDAAAAALILQTYLEESLPPQDLPPEEPNAE
ncbi:MAG: Holliday junction resolvase RuvX [Dehalococcoidales bacterium]|nr:Holliday junction resolvase RuvX [Dehalococcoidales bacterium]